MRARTLALIALLQALPAAAAGLTPLEQAGKKFFSTPTSPPSATSRAPPVTGRRRAGAVRTVN